MRRKDREVTDLSRMRSILEQCDCCRLAMEDEGGPYIVPMNFGFQYERDTLTLYLHSAAEGKKLQLLRKNPHVGFELDCSHQLVAGTSACSYSFLYQSIIGKGTAALLQENVEKAEALNTILRHYAAPRDWHLPTDAFSAVAVIRLTVTQWSCKEHV